MNYRPRQATAFRRGDSRYARRTATLAPKRKQGRDASVIHHGTLGQAFKSADATGWSLGQLPFEEKPTDGISIVQHRNAARRKLTFVQAVIVRLHRIQTTTIILSGTGHRLSDMQKPVMGARRVR